MNIRYIQIEPRWLFQELITLPTDERSCCITLFAYLYCCGGTALYEPDRLAGLCGINELEFGRIWQKIGMKFIRKNDVFFHKIIRKNCLQAKKLSQKRKRAGLRGSEERWQTHSKAITNENENEKVNNKNSNTNNAQLATDALSLQQAIYTLLPPRTQSDRATVSNFARWVAVGVLEKRFDERIYKRIIDYAAEARRQGRVPMAYFVTTLKRELGWRPKAVQNAG